MWHKLASGPAPPASTVTVVTDESSIASGTRGESPSRLTGRGRVIALGWADALRRLGHGVGRLEKDCSVAGSPALRLHRLGGTLSHSSMPVVISSTAG